MNKQVILSLRMTKRWSTFYPKVSARVAKEAHKEKMIAFHRTKGGKQQACLHLNPRMKCEIEIELQNRGFA